MPAIASISDKSLKALERDAQGGFATRACAALAERYPHLLPRFPGPVQLAITNNMLGRAARWDLTQQRSLLAFCELMIAVAANFDEEPRIRDALERSGTPRDRTMTTLPQVVPPEAWQAAEDAAADLPLFIPPALTSAPLLERTAAAIAIVLHDRPEAADPQGAAAAATGLVDRLGLAAEQDAPLTLAVCRSFYGGAFPDRSQPWTGDVFRRGHSPRTILGMLKLRISLDFGRVA